MTFSEYKAAVRDALRRHPRWRAGQAAFNVLYEHRPDLSEQIRGSTIDPFHLYDVPRSFWEWVESEWGDDN